MLVVDQTQLAEALIEEAVRTLQARYQLFPMVSAPISTAAATSTATFAAPDIETTTVIVGVSGGADSLCLLHLLVQLATEWRLNLHVAHLDHALRPESAADAQFVQQLAAQWHLPFHQQRLEPGALAAAPGSLETVARDARYRFLADVGVQQTPTGQVPVIAVAHHADDQAETVLHHLVRGSGLQGIAGMRPVTLLRVPTTSWLPSSTVPESTVTESNLSVIQLVRPLLYVRRTAILQYLQQHQLSWREDQTNGDERYTRNYLRHTILPALQEINPAAVEAVGRLANLAAEESERLARYDRELLTKLQRSAPGECAERIVLDLDSLRTLSQPTQRALLRMALTDLDPDVGHVSFAQMTDLCEQLQTAASGGPHPVVGNLVWSVAGATGSAPARLSLHRAQVLPFLPDQLLLEAGAQIALPLVGPGETAQLLLADGWSLTLSVIDRDELPTDWPRRAQPWRAYFDWGTLGRLRLATAVEGQHFAPLGMAGQQKALGDLFTDHKVPVSLRPRWPLLVNSTDPAACPPGASAMPKNSEVFWVCGLQMGHHARITAQTTQVLVLTIARRAMDRAV